MLRRAAVAFLVGLTAAAIVACGAPPAPQPSPTTVTAPAPAPTPTNLPLEDIGTLVPVAAPSPTVVRRQTQDPTAVVVFAASTFGAALTALASSFMVSSQDATGVSYRFDNSTLLRSMIEQGADADVFVTIDPTQMDGLRQDNLLDGAPSVLAQDRLVVVVGQANPQHVQSFKDLANDGVRFIVAAPSSPTTTAMLAALDKASADPTYGPDFRAKADRNVLARDGDDHLVITRIAAGEVSAGVVYASSLDPTSRSKVQVIDIPDPVNVAIGYPIATLKNGTNMHGGQAFVKYALSPAAQTILSKYGFTNATP